MSSSIETKGNQLTRIEKVEKREIKFSLILKVTLITVSLIVIVSALTNVIIFYLSLRALKDEIRNKLIMVAANSAISINAEKLKQITKPEDEGSPLYLELQSQLQTMQKASDKKLRFIYTVAKTGKKYVYIMDAVPIGKVEHSPVGHKFEINDYPDAYNGFKFPTADKKPERDPEFHTVSQSGYAPIKDSSGNVVGMLGIDMDVSTLKDEERELIVGAIMAFLITLILAVLLGVIFSRYLTKPILLLTKGTRRVAEGDFDTTVKLERKDEFGLLAQSFNSMTLDLKESHETLKRYNLELEEKVRQRTRELSLINKEIKDILDNISQAIFTIDNELIFNPQHSKFASYIFGDISFTGKSLLEVFFPLSDLLPQRNNLNTWLQKVFSLDSSVNWENLEALQPVREVALKIINQNGQEATKYIQISFKPIMNNMLSESKETVAKVMVIAQDITEKKELELAIEMKEKEYKDNINQIVEIIKMDRELFEDYIHECQEHLVEFGPKLIQLKENRTNMDLVNDLFRIMHSL